MITKKFLIDLLKGENKVNKRTYRNYEDMCVLCDKKLIGNANKLYWQAEKIRQYKANFEGKKVSYTIASKEFKDEKGAYVCRNKSKCIKERG